MGEHEKQRYRAVITSKNLALPCPERALAAFNTPGLALQWIAFPPVRAGPSSLGQGDHLWSPDLAIWARLRTRGRLGAALLADLLIGDVGFSLATHLDALLPPPGSHRGTHACVGAESTCCNSTVSTTRSSISFPMDEPLPASGTLCLENIDFLEALADHKDRSGDGAGAGSFEFNDVNTAIDRHHKVLISFGGESFE
jgi:hypothetical protein